MRPKLPWGGVEFYPSFPMKAAVLLVRLTKNHALPDGNKRTALAVTIAFCDVNGFDWLAPAGDDPDGEETYQLMLAIAAASGADLEAVEAEAAAWIADRLHQRK
jgi:death-on-curing protein